MIHGSGVRGQEIRYRSPSFEMGRLRVKQDEMYHREFPRDVVVIELVNS